MTLAKLSQTMTLSVAQSILKAKIVINPFIINLQLTAAKNKTTPQIIFILTLLICERLLSSLN
jgi:hypothetical protein